MDCFKELNLNINKHYKNDYDMYDTGTRFISFMNKPLGAYGVFNLDGFNSSVEKIENTMDLMQLHIGKIYYVVKGWSCKEVSLTEALAICDKAKKEPGRFLTHAEERGEKPKIETNASYAKAVAKVQEEYAKGNKNVEFQGYLEDTDNPYIKQFKL